MRSAGPQIVLGHPEALLDAPQLAVGADDELRGRLVQVGDVALDPGQGTGLGLQVRLTLLSAPTSLMNRLRLTGTFPATAFSALATCSSIPRSVRRARS